MVVTRDVLLFVRSSRKHKFEKVLVIKNSTSLLYLPIPLEDETWKIFSNKLRQLFFADILSEKNPYFGKHLFAKQELIICVQEKGDQYYIILQIVHQQNPGT